MINKISKLKDFGIFHDFAWKTELSEFKKFNLIYGWNRSGKTTISRVFASCEKKCAYDKDKFKQYPENGEFEIKTSDNATIKSVDVTTNALPIKVFNRDFIDDNISFDTLNSCNPIVYVSEEDIESKKQLELLRANKELLTQKYQLAKAKKENAIKIEDNFRISVALTIIHLLTDKKSRDRYYAYDKSKVKEKIDEIGIDNFSDKRLCDEDERNYKVMSREGLKQAQSVFPKLPPTRLNILFEQVKTVLERKIVSELLERLKNPDDRDGGLDEELNDWVKHGFDIHKSRKQFKKCLFCENELSSNFFDSLSKHFSKDYEDLQLTITGLIIFLQKEKLSTIPEDNVELYHNLKDNYKIQSKKYNDVVKKLNDWLEHSKTWLEQKYKNPFDPDIPEMVEAPANYADSLNEIIDELNKIILEHNQKVENHAIEIKNAKEKLELHSIAVALSEQDYGEFARELKTSEFEEKEVLEVINKSITDISELEKKTSNFGTAVNKINGYLKEFFGREEIKLELDGDKKGYIIKRNRRQAKNLSEGEKTAIAFSYFVVKVGEGDFDKSNGIIFIDDPISSFDSNFIYHCFSLINKHFKEVGQLFISTHNFQLFNLVKDWFVGKNLSRKNKGKDECCEFFMVENFTELDVRKARIVKLDKTLRNYKSEYHFLFAKLKEFSEKQDTEYEDFYTIGNMARRFFDIFADFKIPTTGDQKYKMEVLVKNINDPDEKISMVDAGKAYKLVNDFSHNSDPTSTIEHKDKSESKDAIKILLNIVKESDQKHFEILNKEIK